MRLENRLDLLEWKKTLRLMIIQRKDMAKTNILEKFTEKKETKKPRILGILNLYKKIIIKKLLATGNMAVLIMIINKTTLINVLIIDKTLMI